MEKIFLFAGEPSGDGYGGELLHHLKQMLPLYHFEGVGGPEMRKQGLSCLLPMEQFSVIGFVDILLSLPKIVKQFLFIRNHILHSKPQAVVLIDYPGFNLRLAKSLRKHGYKGKIVHYICPTVWAWGQKRIETMSKTLDLLITIFPFEKAYFCEKALKVFHAGHPLQERIAAHHYCEDWLHRISSEKRAGPLIALFPGSRKSEVIRNLPKQLAAAKAFQETHPQVCFVLSLSNETLKPLFKEIIAKSALRLSSDIFLVPKEYTYELMRDSRTAIGKSGTVSLELALHKRPSVIVYDVTPLNRFIATYIVRLKLEHFCIVNILAKKEVFPELIKTHCTPELLLKHLLELNQEGPLRSQCLTECNSIQAMFKEKNASQRAAESIVELLK